MDAKEIVGNMEEFTQEELERINVLATGKAENISVDDMKLFSRWETSNALAEKRFQEEMNALQEKTKADIENSKALNDAAVANLQAQKELALKRLEVIGNG